MGQAKGFLNGNWNYGEIMGPTGPIVYPASHLYIYSILYQITNQGVNIRLAQYIFIIIYCLLLFIILQIYNKTIFQKKQVGNFDILVILLTLILSKRIHSIFSLRLFNDCITMLFLYLSVYFFIERKYFFGCLFYSFSLSIKMNVLLFLPGILVILVLEFGLFKFLKYVFLIFSFQILIAIPFLKESWINYLKRSFSTSRIYLYKWSVNMKFLNEDIFYSDLFGKILMISMILSLLYFGLKWSLKRGIIKSIIGSNKLESNEILEILFTSNFVGFIFLKSFHYQFYVWYFHTLPFLIHSIQIKNYMKILMFCLIEYCWNVFPSTSQSSMLLQSLHGVIFLNLIFNKMRK
eukprot:gene11390-4557_t